MPVRIARITNLVLASGLGFWSLTESIGYSPGKNTLDAVGDAHDERKLNRTLGVVAPALMASTLATDVPLLWRHRKQPTSAPFLLTAAGTLLNIGAFASTLIINVPQNSAIDRWNADAPRPTGRKFAARTSRWA